MTEAPSDQAVEGNEASRAIYVLDTNVLLFDPRALHHFQKSDIVIPITVIEEIDRFKKDLNDTGRNARSVSRMLDKMRAQGSLQTGVTLSSGGRLRVSMGDDIAPLPDGFGPSSNDNRIKRLADSPEDRRRIIVCFRSQATTTYSTSRRAL